MKRIPMVAVRSMRYGTRALRAGDTFDAARQDARVLVAVGMASEAQNRFIVQSPLKNEPSPPSEPRAPETPVIAGEIADSPMPEVALSDTREATGDDLAPLRVEYEALTGRAPDRRWGATRLRGEIASVKSQADLLAHGEADAE